MRGVDPEKKDVFPRTASTWIQEKLLLGEEACGEVNRHIMSVYAWPLEVYFRGSSGRSLGEPCDIVEGFFADRLARPDFLGGWLKSGLRLRRWLMNAFCYYLQELRRERRRDSRRKDLAEDLPASAESPEEALDRAFVESVVTEALAGSREACEAQGLGRHWQVFLRHFYHGTAYRDLAGELGVEPSRAAVMARTASQRFRAAVREILAKDGVGEDEIDGEIESLLEVMRS